MDTGTGTFYISTRFLNGRTALAHIIYEGFYCNRRYAATTGLTTGSLAALTFDVLLGTGTLLISDCSRRIAGQAPP